MAEINGQTEQTARSMKVYLAIPIRFCSEGSIVQDELERRGIVVMNPCRIDSHNLSIEKDRIPAHVANQCYEMIDAAEAIIFFADSYGRDCAAEVGYAFHARIPVFPISLAKNESENLVVDWMIRPIVQPISKSFDELVLNLSLLRSRELNK